MIKEHNSRPNASIQLGIKEFSDYSEEETQNLVGGFTIDEDLARNYQMEDSEDPNITTKVSRPTQKDWRELMGDIISYPKTCKSSWAFIAATLMESYLNIFSQDGAADGKKRISVQYLLDCDDQDMNQGCQKGNSFNAINFLKKNGYCWKEEYDRQYLDAKRDCPPEWK